MHEQKNLPDPRDNFFMALGRAAYGFMSLEWSVIWLVEALAPGKLSSASHPSSGTPLAQYLEDIAAEVIVSGRELPEGVVSFVNQFAVLAERHGRMISGHPQSGLAADVPKLLFTARTGRFEWRLEDVQAATEAFEGATLTALQLIEAANTGLPRQSNPHDLAPAGLQPVTSITNSGTKARSDAAARVRARLAPDERVTKLAATNLEVYTVDNLFDAEECATLIDLIERDLYPSGLLAAAPEPGFRTSMSCNLNRQDPPVAELERRICDLLGADPLHGETAQGQRYEVGQEFKPHHDFFHPGQFYSDQAAREGGQRTWTAMVFLNEPAAGGCTNFPDAGARVAPQAGKLLLWNNMDGAGEPNPYSLHQGMPVQAGSKYVITKWFRERVWEPGAAGGGSQAEAAS